MLLTYLLYFVWLPKHFSYVLWRVLFFGCINLLAKLSVFSKRSTSFSAIRPFGLCRLQEKSSVPAGVDPPSSFWYLYTSLAYCVLFYCPAICLFLFFYRYCVFGRLACNQLSFSGNSSLAFLFSLCKFYLVSSFHSYMLMLERTLFYKISVMLWTSWMQNKI